MFTLIIKDNNIIYIFDNKTPFKLTNKGMFIDDLISPKITASNSKTIKINTLPKFFNKLKWKWNDETKQLEIKEKYKEDILNLHKQEKLQEINNLCQEYINKLTETYPNAELLTFDKQESEARALVANPISSTPFLTPLAEARGISVTELANKVIIKADLFTAASASLIGQRQKYEDMLNNATTIEEVEAIIPEYIINNS